MRILLTLTIFLSICACANDNLRNRRVPLHNKAFLDGQNKFYDNYQVQDAYMSDSKKDKSFFNNLFVGDSTEKVTVIDETDTGNLQRISKEYKDKAINDQETAAINVASKPVSITQDDSLDEGFVPNNAIVSKYKLLPKSLVGTYVQIAAFTKYQDAYNITAPLLKFNNVVINERKNDSGGIWYRVRVGPSANRDLALLLQKELTKGGYKNSLIIVEK